MSTLTEQLQSLINALHYNKCSLEDFKQSAMTLARQGADITVRSTSGAHPTLLHVLVCRNNDGANNAEIAELARLNPEILGSKYSYLYCSSNEIQ